MADYILDKGFPVLSTYNTSAPAGVTAFRAVKLVANGTVPAVDIQTVATAGNFAIGVVQENVDAVKVATGKVTAGVRLIGVTKVYVTTGAGIVLGGRVSVGAAGGVVNAAGAGTAVLGVVVNMSVANGVPATGDIIDVFLTPGAQF